MSSAKRTPSGYSRPCNAAFVWNGRLLSVRATGRTVALTRWPLKKAFWTPPTSATRLAGPKGPRSYELVETVDRTAMGKLDKRALRRPYWPTDRTTGG